MDCLGNYTILSNIGDGSYASVKLARRLQDNKLYALKKISFMDSITRDKKAALNQVRLLASIQSDYIIAFKSAFFDENEQTLYIVMEYAENGDLAQKIQQHQQNQTRFKEQDIWKVIYHISRGLKTLHENLIMHRDLKPANIVQCANNKYKLADLNISRRIKQNQLVDTMIGTPFYLSPEVWKRDQYDYKTDMWSLGVVAYQMAALELPFPANTMEQLFKKVVKSGKCKKIPSYYSEELNRLIQSLMNTDSAQRPGPCEVISKCLYSTFKCTMDPPHENQENPLLNTIIWPQDITNMIQLIPKPQYDDEALVQRPETANRSTAKSFRLRTNTFSRIDQPSPKCIEQKSQISQIGRLSRRKSVKQSDQHISVLQDLSKKILNEATDRILQISAKQIVLKPPLLRKAPSISRND